MLKIELVYQDILFNALEKKARTLTQAEIARKLSISLSTVNHALKPLKRMNAIEIKTRNFIVIDPKKILYHWASIRNLEKDIIYKTRVEKPVTQIEKEMPAKTIYSAYSAYKFRYKDVPADYSEVYIYADAEEIKKRFPYNKNTPNLFVLKKHNQLDQYGELTTIALTFVDLWNLHAWYAKEFLKALEVKLSGILE